MSKLKRLGSKLGAFLVAASAFAQQEGDIDITPATGAVSKIQTAVSNLFTTSLIPAVLTIIGVSLAIYFIFLGVRYLARAGKSGK